MRGAGVLSLLLILTLAIFAYAEASPFHQLFSTDDIRINRASSRPTPCALGRHWSPQYGKCIRTVYAPQ